MEVVLFHVGNSYPNHFEQCIDQYRLFNHNIKTSIIINKELYNQFKPLATKHDINIVLTKNLKISAPLIYNKDPLDFWNITFLRLYYLYEYMSKFNINNIIHFENDVMIYFDIDKYKYKFVDKYSTIALPHATDHHSMASFMYTSNKSLYDMISFFNTCLSQSPSKILNKYGMDMINEMTLIRAYSKEFPKILKELPSLPQETIFDGLFDPAGYGQYLGGTPHNGKQSGWMEERHYIGKKLINNDISVEWCDKSDYNKPIVIDNKTNIIYNINSLHVHSKDLFRFRS